MNKHQNADDAENAAEHQKVIPKLYQVRKNLLICLYHNDIVSSILQVDIGYQEFLPIIFFYIISLALLLIPAGNVFLHAFPYKFFLVYRGLFLLIPKDIT